MSGGTKASQVSGVRKGVGRGGWASRWPGPGEFPSEGLAHYRGIVDAAFEFGLAPVVTLHHFTNPIRFAQRSG
jgi:beta-glucosidase